MEVTIELNLVIVFGAENTWYEFPIKKKKIITIVYTYLTDLVINCA